MQQLTATDPGTPDFSCFTGQALLDRIISLPEEFNAYRQHNHWQPDLRNVHISSEHGPKLKGVNLRQANLNGASFTGVTLVDVNLEFTELSNATFIDCRLYNLVCRYSNFFRSGFHHCQIYSAELKRAKIILCRFDGVLFLQGSVDHADFDCTALNNCVMIGVKNLDTALMITVISNYTDIILAEGDKPNPHHGASVLDSQAYDRLTTAHSIQVA